MAFDVETCSLQGRVTTVGSAGGHALVIDRPATAGGGGLGFSGGDLLHLAVAACVSNDLFREAQAMGLALSRVRVSVRGGFEGAPPVSTGVEYAVEIAGDAPADVLRALVARVDAIAEIPETLRRGATVRLGRVEVGGGERA